MPDEDKNFGGSLFWILESDDITIFTLSSNHGQIVLAGKMPKKA